MATTVVFDVLGTLFSLDRPRHQLVELGAPPIALELWFAEALRDAFAYSHAGEYLPLAEVMQAGLPRTLARFGLENGADAVARIMGTMSELDPMGGAAEACELLSGSGCSLVTLTNGSAESTEGLLERGGLRRFFARIRSCDEVRTTKPDRHVYDLARDGANGDVWMIAAHGWDVAGALTAGLRGIWVAGTEPDYLSVYPEPNARVDSLAAAAREVLAASPG